ncbi:MAG: OPT/YSL family transporter, partial [Phycisphaerales bacterium]|nr:OPT/YSL family transporter [Phycisphaerales bacterium]
MTDQNPRDARHVTGGIQSDSDSAVGARRAEASFGAPGTAGDVASVTRQVDSIPPLPDDATTEQREEHWYRYVYQGDRVPQLTLRAVLMGGLIGMLMSVSNLYTTVKLGWAFGVAITACVLSYVIWNALRAITGKRLSQMSILENNCMQSTASAAGYSTGGTVGVAFGALLLITGAHTPWQTILPFVFFTAALGVFLAIPMKRQMINVEQLKFPSGIAAAETLRSLYSTGKEASQKAAALVISLGLGALVALLRTYPSAVNELDKVGRAPEWLLRLARSVHLPEMIAYPSPLKKGSMGMGFEPSVLLIAAGMIVGLRVSLSMLAGSLILHLLVAPWLVEYDTRQIAKGVTDYVTSFSYAPDGSGNFNPIRWALWTGTSIMVFSSLTAVAIQWRTIVRAFAGLRG